MLLLLAEYLTRFDSAFGVFQYLTLRGILAAGTALAISLAIGPFIPPAPPPGARATDPIKRA